MIITDAQRASFASLLMLTCVCGQYSGPIDEVEAFCVGLSLQASQNFHLKHVSLSSLFKYHS
jgi:hypothetical protein